jgi:hypothetical protein
MLPSIFSKVLRSIENAIPPVKPTIGCLRFRVQRLFPKVLRPPKALVFEGCRSYGNVLD